VQASLQTRGRPCPSRCSYSNSSSYHSSSNRCQLYDSTISHTAAAASYAAVAALSAATATAAVRPAVAATKAAAAATASAAAVQQMLAA
jgi:hypothetical protein